MYSRLTQVKTRVRAVAVATAAVVMVLGNLASVNAAALASGSIELGDPRPSETTTYLTSATGVSVDTIGCVILDLGANSDGTGAISGMDTASSTLDAFSLAGGTWAVDNTASANHELRATNGTPAAGTNGSATWGAVDNGDTDATTYFGVLTTYTTDTCVTAVDTITLAFVYKDGEPVQLTVEPTLSFVCVAVAEGQAVNGATTQAASGATGIDFTNATTPISTSTNGISAHDIQVDTNAAGGYIVYLRHTQDLTNANSDTITNFTGTNATPASFSAAGTEGWGYTTDDATLSGGTADRFTTGGGDLWSGFTTSNEEVMDNTTATTSTETARIGHQAGIATTTPAGTYQTTLVYTIVATY